MPKTKSLEDHLDIAPPVAECISAKYLIKLPVTDRHLESTDELNAYTKKLLEKKLGDEVDVQSLKVKQPSISAKTWAKLLKRTPNAKLYATVDF